MEERIRVEERRRKRFIIPIIYFLLEIIFYWLVLSLLQLEFTFKEWSVWSMVLFFLGVAYAVIKTVYIYKRQKDYPREGEITKLFG